ncbi:MAG: methyltransferase [Pseudomonadota bacterium]
MSETTLPPQPLAPPPGLRERLLERLRRWRLAKIASPSFQRWAARNPLTRRRARHDAARLYDLVAGFVYAQVLQACVSLDLFERLRDGPVRIEALAHAVGIAPDRMESLCQAAASLDLLRREANGLYGLGDLGAASLGVPGLDQMIRHHQAFYRDMADPVALLRGETEPELARFWSYVRSSDVDPDTARTYSALMASSQDLVAEETLDTVDLSGIAHLADIGGGTGRFLSHVARRATDLRLTLMDLPGVIDAARPVLADTGLDSRIRCLPGSFLQDPLPADADAISLIRVLYDHDDDVVRRLLGRVFAALPPGGRLIVSEPMSGGHEPSRSGDAYFGFYTMAMTTGRPRSPARHMQLLAEAGFQAPKALATRRPFLTGVVEARKPA